jgi:hypothetical protein
VEHQFKARVGYLKAGNAMLIISEKIAPPKRSQLFNDRVAEDAVLKRLDEGEDRWVKQFIADLAGSWRPG